MRADHPTEPERPWDEGRLGTVLSNSYAAFGRRGRVDATRAAAQLGVSPSTVRRWVRHGIPARRLPEIQERILPPASMFTQEQRELAHARESLWDIVDRGAPVNPAWVKQGWLKPHTLAIVLLRDRGVCVPRISRTGSDRSGERLTAAGGIIIEQLEFRNRFRAQVAKGELLEAVRDWRIVIPSGQIHPGRTQAWLADAPRPSLDHLRDHPQVKIPVTKPRKQSHTTVRKTTAEKGP